MISDRHIRYETLSLKFNEPPKTFGRCLKRILCRKTQKIIVPLVEFGDERCKNTADMPLVEFGDERCKNTAGMPLVEFGEERCKNTGGMPPCRIWG